MPGLPADPPGAAGRREPGDWLLLAALTALWGSSFLFTRLAVGELAFEQVVSARLLLAAVLLVPLAAALRRPLPRGARTWGFFALIALLGNLLPFSLITWGQRSIGSGLTGILMAVMPLATLGLAHFFVPGEGLTRRRVLGFLVGFAGVLVLIGPAALAAGGARGGELPAMLAVLAGALCYGVSTILARLQPPRDALSTAAAVITLAALASLPAGLGPPLPDLARLSAVVIGALLFLGLFATATAMILYFRLIRSAGPGFTSQLNYLIPVWALGVGLLFLGEEPGVHHLAGLLLILTGILVARRGA